MKDMGEKMKTWVFCVARLKSYREDSVLQNLAQAIFDYKMDDADWFGFLFANEGNIKRIWQFIYLSFVDNEQLLAEQKYKQQRRRVWSN